MFFIESCWVFPCENVGVGSFLHPEGALANSNLRRFWLGSY